MHKTRAKINSRIPIPRKGTKYVARANDNSNNSVPVVVALRDMLGIANTAKEVQDIINSQAVKVNGKLVRDKKESVNLFNILEAGKKYSLTLAENGRFLFEETKENVRICKVIRKTMVKNKKIQLTMHDGTNIITNEKININDTVVLDFEGKLTKTIHLRKGNEVMVIKGKKSGRKGKIEEVEENMVKVNIGGSATQIEKSRAIAI